PPYFIYSTSYSIAFSLSYSSSFPLHAALPIFSVPFHHDPRHTREARFCSCGIDPAWVENDPNTAGNHSHPRRCPHGLLHRGVHEDRKSTRLNSSHEWISYAVFCLKKKKKNTLR